MGTSPRLCLPTQSGCSAHEDGARTAWGVQRGLPPSWGRLGGADWRSADPGSQSITHPGRPGHLCGTRKSEDERDQTTHRARRGQGGSAAQSHLACDLAFPYIFHRPVPTVGRGWGRSCPSGSGARALSSAWDERPLGLMALLPCLGGWRHTDLQAHGEELVRGPCGGGPA